MIWAIKYQARKSPQITQFSKSSKQVLSRELQRCSRAPGQMLPAAGSGCYFIIISPHTVQTDSPGTGKFPSNQICVKQAASNLQRVQFQAHLLHLLDQRQKSNPFSGGNLWSPGKIHPKTNYKLYYFYNCTSATPTQKNNNNKKSLIPKPSILHHHFISGLLLQKIWF